MIVFGFILTKMPAEAEDQKRVNRDYKIGALQNLLQVEKELNDKEKSEEKDTDEDKKNKEMTRSSTRAGDLNVGSAGRRRRQPLCS